MVNHGPPHSTSVNRRHFVGTSAGLAAAGVATMACGKDAGPESRQAADANNSIIKPGATILFQGDSITDAGRSRDEAATPNAQPALGDGYAWLAAAALLVDRPNDNLKIFNRGISGNKVYQLAERWDAEALELEPDVLSILIGVNDIWHTLNGAYDGTVEKYEADYNSLIKRTKEAIPDVKLVICEPFVLRCGAVNDTWFPEFDKYRAAAKRVAQEAGAVFVPFHKMFERASKIAPPARWAKDGVHPSPDGASLMAHLWRQCVVGTAT
ncbi:MAG TPA: SGNH/GDSL hydrolase family protein [Lacipirellula sp.]